MSKLDNINKYFKFGCEIEMCKYNFLYILACWNEGDNNYFLYVGKTTNIFKRFRDHLNRRNTITKTYAYKKLIYYEMYDNLTSKRVLEKEIALNNLSDEKKIAYINSKLNDETRSNIELINTTIHAKSKIKNHLNPEWLKREIKIKNIEQIAKECHLTEKYIKKLLHRFEITDPNNI